MGGLSFPRGAMILISPWLMHRHEAFWKDPDLFDPDRFTPIREKEIPKGAYLPFGQGPRICIGAAFGLIEATLCLARVIARYDIDIMRPETVRPAARLTTRTVSGIAAKLKRRR